MREIEKSKIKLKLRMVKKRAKENFDEISSKKKDPMSRKTC